MQDLITKSCSFYRNSIRKPVISDWLNGADGRIRTGDLILTKDALYLLSYISASFIRRTQELLYYSLRENAIPSGQKNGSNPFFYISEATCLRRFGVAARDVQPRMTRHEAAYKRKL